MHSLYLPVFASLFTTSLAASCKCTPLSGCWPSPAEWSALNNTVNGALIKTVPIASVCYEGPNYDVGACKNVNATWFDAKMHAEDPASIMYSRYAHDSCLPTNNPKGKCTVDGYPTYVIDARNANTVAAGINFAREKNIRLVIKNTGHDFLGRSTGKDSLSIWTHHLKKFELHDSFAPKGCKTNAVPAVTLGSGRQMRETYEELHKEGLVIVAGADFSVGLGGYMQGGGHGPLSSTYGLGIDQVLEYELVTPEGKVITANECQNIDLFWAMRGGGPGTFGVLLSATVKTYPSPKVSFNLFTANLTTENTDIFWKAVGEVFTTIPGMMDQGMSGYIYVFDYAGKYSLAYLTHAVNKTPAELAKIFDPVVKLLSSSPYKENFVSGLKMPVAVQFPSYFDFWKTVLGKEQASRPEALLPSRLIPAESLARGKESFIAKKLEKSGKKGHHVIAAGLLAGKGVAQHKDLDVAVHPAWRSAYLNMYAKCHVVSSIQFPNEEPGRSEAFETTTNVYEQALIDMAPDSGAYVNEANPNTKNFQDTFFGKNYSRLLQIKKKVDPKGVFYCKACVGSEFWKVTDEGLCKI